MRLLKKRDKKAIKRNISLNLAVCMMISIKSGCVNVEIFACPVVNPDGYKHLLIFRYVFSGDNTTDPSARFWRKNRRRNFDKDFNYDGTYGVDLVFQFIY
jgi:hypothetical protein